MANLLGGSTIGGKDILSVDVMNQFIYEIQTNELENKMKKYESASNITNFSTADTYIKNPKQNGLWQVVNGQGMPNNMYNYGQLLSFSNEGARFQLYAPHKNNASNKSELFFRTGWDSDIKSWETICTRNTLDYELNKKFDKTGGDINGHINASSHISTNSKFKVLNSTSSCELAMPSTSQAAFSSASAVTKFTFDKPLYITGELYSNNSKVWHAGNFNPSNYQLKQSETLANDTDLNTIKTEGKYRCYKPVNAHSKVANLWNYIEVIKHSDSYVLQKTYSYDGNYAFMRTCNNGTWTAWKSLTGALTHSATLTANSWTESSGVYSATVTHNLGSSTIASVVLTDSNNLSVFSGFEVVSSTVIKVFSSTNAAGKVVITAVA